MEHWIRKLSEKSFLKKIKSLGKKERNALMALRMAEDVEFFARHVLGDHCRLPFAELHHQLFRWHQMMGRPRLPKRRGRRFVLAAPRGSAKSTVASLALPLHDILYGREKYLVLLSATERQAIQRLKAIRRELEEGEVTRYCPIPRGSEQRFTTRSLTYNGVQMDVFGAGAEIRGISSQGYRPTKIILDDAEASRAATSGRAREQLSEWFSEVVEHLGDGYTHIMVIGTILHSQGLISSLLERPDFEGVLAKSIEGFSTEEKYWNRWRAKLMDFSTEDRRQLARDYFEKHRKVMEQGTQVLWKEKEDYEDLMAQLTLQGRRAFYQEKQNTPLGPEDALFDQSSALEARLYDDRLDICVCGSTGRKTAIRSYTRDVWDRGRRFGYLDAALGKGRSRGRGDFAALAVVVLLPDKSLVLDYLWARRASPTDQIKRIFDLHESFPFELLGVEGTGFQELMMLPLEEERKRRRAMGRLVDFSVQSVHPKQAKQSRIASLEPLLANGTMALSPGLDEEFWEEFSSYPRSEHDDALDAAAGALALALANSNQSGRSGWQGGSRRKSLGSGRF